LRNRDIWPPCLPAFGVAGSMFTIAGLWGVPYLRDVHQMSLAQAALHTSLLLAGFAVGGFAVGALSDRLGRRRPVILAGVVLYLLCLLPLVWRTPLVSPWGEMLFLVMGIGAAGFTLSWAVAKELNRPALSGTATSVVNTGVFLGVAVFQPLLGWILDLRWDGRLSEGARVYAPESYQWGFGVLFVTSLAGLAGAYLTRETHCRYVHH
jgi:MFS family permease